MIGFAIVWLDATSGVLAALSSEGGPSLRYALVLSHHPCWEQSDALIGRLESLNLEVEALYPDPEGPGKKACRSRSRHRHGRC